MLAHKCIRLQQHSWLQNPRMVWFGLVWMAALELIESPAQPFAQAGPPAATCPEPSPAKFWVSPRIKPLLLYRCSSSFIISVSIYWACSCKSMSVLYWGACDCTQHCRCGLTSAELCGGITSPNQLLLLWQIEPKSRLPPLPRGRVAASWSTWCPPGPSEPFCRAAFHVFGPSLCWNLIPCAIQRLPQQIW